MEQVFTTLLVWLLAAAWIFFLVNWAITGDIAPGEAIFGSLIALLLALATARQIFPHAGLLSLITLGGGAIALPALRAYLNRAAHAQMDAELMERASLAYEFDPKNYGSLINLAEVCYKNGLLEQAVSHLEKAIQIAPMMASNEKRRLKMWEDELQNASRLGYTPCMNCGARQPVSAVRCSRCGQLVLPLLVQGRWIPRQLLQKVFWVWVVSAGATGLSLFWRAQLVGLSALVAILATLGAALSLIVWVIRKR